MPNRCGCEVGDDCTRTTMCAVQAAVEDTREPLIDALDHIMRVCRNTDVQTKRLLWIEKRAECAINGTEEWREYDYPKVRKAAKENNGLRDRIEQLEAVYEAALKVERRFMLTEGGYGAIDVLQTSELTIAISRAQTAGDRLPKDEKPPCPHCGAVVQYTKLVIHAEGCPQIDGESDR